MHIKGLQSDVTNTLLFGFGANSVPYLTEVSDLFSGTGDLLNPIVMTDNLQAAYYSCLKRVEINLPCCFSSVIAKAVEYAQQSQVYFLNEQDYVENAAGGVKGNNQACKSALNYFVLYLFCTAIIDDVPAAI